MGLDPGISEDDIYRNFYETVHPDDKKLIQYLQTSCFEKDRTEVTDLRIILDDGQVKWVRNYIVPVFRNQQLVMLKGVNLDITAQKTNEIKLALQNEKLKAVLKAIPDQLFIIDNNGNFLAHFDVDSDELLTRHDSPVGNTIFNTYKAEISGALYVRIKKVLADQEIDVFNFNYNVNGLITEYFETRIVPLSEDKVLVLSRNITDRIQNENEIKRLSLAIRQSPVSIVIIDLNANIEYVNPCFEELTGYNASEVIGKNTRMLEAGGDDLTERKKRWETINSGNTWSGEWIGKKKNGDLFWESATISPIHDENGKVNNYLSVSQDITIRKKSEEVLRDNEEKYRFMFMHNPQPMWIYDTESLRFLEVNSAAIDHYGYSRGEFLSMTIEDIRPKEDIEKFRKDLADTNAHLNHAGVWRHLKKSGEIIVVDIRSHSISFNNRGARHVLVNDITELKRIEQDIMTLNANLENIVKERTSQLENLNNNLLNEIEERKRAELDSKKAKVEAETANKAKSAFLSRMSHELRTPLNSILGFAQLLQMNELKPKQEKGVSYIINSGKHLLRLINEVLDISRIEAGHLKLNFEPVHVNFLIDELTDLVKPQAIKRKIKLNKIYFPDNQICVKSDQQHLQQILINLLNNAIKYNVDGGTVTVKAEKRQPDLNGFIAVRISVTDTGIGILPSDLPKIFVPFERIGAEKTTTEGTGLGLTVVKQFAEAIGSDIFVESEPGRGSTFWFDLPFCEPSSPQTAGTIKMETGYAVNLNHSGSVLYIEDNLSNIDLVVQILSASRPGINVITDIYGGNALALAVEHLPDVILLDLDLPDIHGIDVLSQLKADQRVSHIPVVIISADAMPFQLKQLYKLGANNYLTKPLDVIGFLSVIDDLLLK